MSISFLATARSKVGSTTKMAAPRQTWGTQGAEVAP